MKIFRCSSLLALALWHVGCDGARVGAPKQQEGSFSNEVAPYEEEMYIPDESESYVRIALRELVVHYVVKLEHPLIARTFL
jgi:hypothetical protein